MGCRRRADQSDLVRLVGSSDGSVRVGRTLAGRGAWLCAGSPRCLELAARRGALSRALRQPVSDEEIAALVPDLLA